MDSCAQPRCGCVGAVFLPRVSRARVTQKVLSHQLGTDHRLLPRVSRCRATLCCSRTLANESQRDSAT